ncbi:MAG: DNA-directed RNA polymerase subunit omega [Dorea sp.]|nr:DNA-directed RNA polymerase subunit omega [Dorea sp.]
MLHPSYTDLMKVVNKDVEEGETKVVNSRYSIVMATAKRAREIIDDAEPLVPVKNGEKPLSIAIDELNQAKIKVAGEDESQEKPQETADESVEETMEETMEESGAESGESEDVPA